MIKTHKLFSYLIILALFMLVNIATESKNSKGIELNVLGIKTFAQSNLQFAPNCTDFGARNWNVPISFQDGYDCLCKPREKVKGNCGGTVE